MQEKDISAASTFFVEAQKICPLNKEIVFYKTSVMVVPLIETLNKEELSQAEIKRRLDPVIAEIDSGILKQSKSEHFLHFYRGLLYLYMQEFDKAVVDLYQAIKNNEESSAKYHMYLGLAYGCMNLLKEAMKDFTVVIKLKEDFVDAYYNRGKCAYLLGNADLAFTDFQKLLLLRPVFYFVTVRMIR